jgi:hypothetical protein
MDADNGFNEANNHRSDSIKKKKQIWKISKLVDKMDDEFNLKNFEELLSLVKVPKEYSSMYTD